MTKEIITITLDQKAKDDIKAWVKAGGATELKIDSPMIPEGMSSDMFASQFFALINAGVIAVSERISNGGKGGAPSDEDGERYADEVMKLMRKNPLLSTTATCSVVAQLNGVSKNTVIKYFNIYKK